MNTEELVTEFMAAVHNDTSKTEQTKAEILAHVKKFAAFIEAKANTPAPTEEPVKVD